MASISHAIWAMCQIYGLNTVHEDRDVMEFGVFTGTSAREFISYCRLLNIRFNKWIGFDSFIGLPNEKDFIIEDEHIKAMTEWHEGQYSSKDYFKTNNLIETMNAVSDTITKDNEYFPISLIAGFYENSLTPELAKAMKPAAFIHMDVDLYLSCYQALDWLCKNGLIVKDTVIIYDDWIMPDGKTESGEQKAHREISEKYNLDWQEYRGPELHAGNMCCKLRG